MHERSARVQAEKEDCMSVKNEYLAFREHNQLKTSSFNDRVRLQYFLRDRLQQIWAEGPKFSNGGLLSNYMTGLALGFAYYDCSPTSFCKTRCYGLPISGLHDYYMLRLGVVTSESLKTGDQRYLDALRNHLRGLNLRCLKVGHWGDAVPEQVPHISQLVTEFPLTTFWWYTRKREIAIAVNELGIPNLRAYLSLDPSAAYPASTEYKFGMTYLFGDGIRHKNHSDILKDKRLVAVFPLKKGRSVEDPKEVGIWQHPKMCIEKMLLARTGAKGQTLCLSCSGRCNFA